MDKQKYIILFWISIIFNTAIIAQSLTIEQEQFIHITKKIIDQDKLISYLKVYKRYDVEDLSKIDKLHIYLSKTNTILDSSENLEINYKNKVLYFWDISNIFFYDIIYFVVIDKYEINNNVIEVHLRIINFLNKDFDKYTPVKGYFKFKNKKGKWKLSKKRINKIDIQGPLP